MKKAVGHLIPFMEKEREEARVLNGSVEEEASHFVHAWSLFRSWPERLLFLWAGASSVKLLKMHLVPSFHLHVGGLRAWNSGL